MRSTSNMITNDDLIQKSKEILDPSVFDFISGGAGSEWAVSNNTNVYNQYQIVPRVLQKYTKIETTLNLFGECLQSPILIAPCAFHKLVCEQGELATAKSAEKTGTIFTLSTMSSYSIEKVAASSNFSKS